MYLHIENDGAMPSFSICTIIQKCKEVSLLFLTEKTHQQKGPTDQSKGLWELYLYRQKNGRRKAPSGRELSA